MIPLGTAAGELPNFSVLDPLRFQDLCREIWSVNPEYATADVFGTPDQAQFGADIVGYRKDSLIDVGQCKRVNSSGSNRKLVKDACDEFVKNYSYWRDRGLRKFVLFISSDTSPTQIQEEYSNQRLRLRGLRIDFEIWGQSKIASELYAFEQVHSFAERLTVM